MMTLKQYFVRAMALMGALVLMDFALGCSGGAGGDDVADETYTIPVDTSGVKDLGGGGGTKDLVDDPAGGDDTPDTVEYPKPGTIEYWKEVVPGHWKQSPTCVDWTAPEGCEADVVVTHRSEFPEGTGEWGCEGTDYVVRTLSGTLGVYGSLCLYADGRVTAESTLTAVDGTISEHVLANGECSVKADGMPATCVRHADCAVGATSALCTGMQVEYWIDFCYHKKDGGVCGDAESQEFHFVKVK